MYNNLIMLWGPVVFVLLAEHVLLTMHYKKRSSLQRLLYDRSGSSKADVMFFFFYYAAFSNFRTILAFFAIPGLVYVVLLWLRSYFDFYGLFGHLMPANVIAAAAIWLVLIDLPVYFAHVAMHKIPFLWNFHKLHHSATEMNVITGVRVSIAETFFTDLVSLAILSMFLGLPDPAITTAVLLVRRVIDLVQHSDLPWDYGRLGYVIASPRFHRLHHSQNPIDFDANYANIFSFWDYLFNTVASRYRLGTQCADDCELGLDTPEGEAHNSSLISSLESGTLIYRYISLGRDFRDKFIRKDVD